MARATHRGTCQLCGHVQKLPRGRLSVHGYSVLWQSFVGTCPGSGGLPYEQATDLIEAAAEHADAAARHLAALSDAERARVNGVWVSEYHAAMWNAGERKSRTVARLLKAGEFTVEDRGVRFVHSRTGRSELAPVYDFDVDAVAHLNGVRAAQIMSEAARLSEYVSWLRMRVATWEPTDLLPVEDETPNPNARRACVHYRCRRTAMTDSQTCCVHAPRVARTHAEEA